MAHTLPLTGHIRVPELAAHHSRRLVYAGFVFAGSALAIGVITAIAYWSGHPLVVPSLGPTAFLVFNRSQSSAARPRNIVCGHLIGAIAGYVALVVFGVQHAPSVVAGGLSPSRIGAAVLSIALTSAVMILLRVEHGPAGATTLIVSLGFMTTPGSVAVLMAGVVCLAVLGVGIDRSVGLGMPLWSGQRRRPQSGSHFFHPRRSLLLPEAVEGNGNGHAKSLLPQDTRYRVDDPLWLIGPGRGHPVLVGADACTVKVQDAYAGGNYSLLEVTFDPHPASSLLHAHYDFAETYFVLEGEVLVEVGTERRRAGARSVISVPVGIAHSVVAAKGRPARCICITDRARHSDLEYLP